MKFKKNDVLLTSSFALLILIIFAMSIMGVVITKRMNIIFNQIYKDSFNEWVETEQANANLIAVHRAMKDVALSKNEVQFDAAIKDVAKYDAKINKNFSDIDKINTNNGVLDDVYKAYNDWAPIRAKTIEFAKNKQYEKAADVTRTEGAVQVDLIAEKMQLLIDSEKAEAQTAFQNLQDISSGLTHKFDLAIIFAVILASIISIFVRIKIKNYETILQREKEELRITLDSIGDGVITIDINRNVQRLNKIAEEFTGWKSNEAFGIPFTKVFNITNIITGEKSKNPVEEVLLTDEICQLENHTILTSRNGIKRHIADSAAPIKDINDKTIGVVMIFRDVTEHKKMEKEINEREVRFHSLFENMISGAAIYEVLNNGDSGKDYIIKDFNQAALKMEGKQKDEVIGKSLLDLRSNIDEYGLIPVFKKVWESGESTYFPMKVYIDSKFYNWYDNHIFRLESGEIVALYNDVTEKKTMHEKIRESEEKYRLLIENQTDLIIKTDIKGGFLYASPSYCKLFGCKGEELLGNTYIPFVHKDDLPIVKKAVADLLKPPYICSYEGRAKTIYGFRWIEWKSKTLFNEQGEITAIVGTGRDITEQKKREEEIVHLNYHDVLTGLYNRAFLQEEIKRLDTDRQLPISIIMGDVNGLKIINDGFGHAEGDKMLIEIAKILSKCCRNEDIVARISGDEFCIVLPKTCNEVAHKICKRIYKACIDYGIKKDKEILSLSISLGHATKTNISESIDSIRMDAEEFMYRHKLLESRSMHSSIITSIKATMVEKSHETDEHAARLVVLSKLIGQELKLTEEQLNELDLFATLHDIGKMSIDDAILNKQGQLIDSEWYEMKKHPEVGYRIAMASPELKHIANYILSHHERWDGSGYPQGLAGESIPLLSRILSVVDAYDAMTENRPYRKAMQKDVALDEIERNAGTQFDPKVVETFLKLKNKVSQ